MGGGNHATTDDTGQYRLLALPPGDYIVMGLIRETWVLDSDPKQVFGQRALLLPRHRDGDRGAAGQDRRRSGGRRRRLRADSGRR